MRKLPSIAKINSAKIYALKVILNTQAFCFHNRNQTKSHLAIFFCFIVGRKKTVGVRKSSQKSDDKVKSIVYTCAYI